MKKIMWVIKKLALCLGCISLMATADPVAAGWFSDLSDDFLSSKKCWLSLSAKKHFVTLTEEGYLIFNKPIFYLDKVSEDMIMVRRLGDGHQMFVKVKKRGRGYIGELTNGHELLFCFN